MMRHTICDDTDTQATYEKNRVQIVEVDAGERHSVCLLADGRVMAWGNEDKGALGTQWMPSRRYSVRDNEKLFPIPTQVQLNDDDERNVQYSCIMVQYSHPMLQYCRSIVQ